MKRKYWKTALVFSLVLYGSTIVLARGGGGGGGHGGGGGGGHGGGGGGGGGGHPGGGGFQGGGGGFHAPGGGQAGFVGGRAGPIQGGVAHAGGLPANGGISRAIPIGGAVQRAGFNQSGIGSRPFTGNSVNINNRSFNVGHNSYQPSYYQHSGYHGYWNGNRGYGMGTGLGVGLLGYGLGSNFGYGGGYGNGYGWGLGNGYGGYGGYGNGGYGGYGYQPFGWGLGGWGLGSMNYSSGYLGYNNPYYANSGSAGYNYSQPISVSYAASQPNGGNGGADTTLNDAVAAFKANNYDAALDLINKGIVQFPSDAVLHEFRSLVLFAKSDYQQSAATIHSVLAVGPGWDWTTVSGFYADVAIYTEQLRALETFVKSNPQDAASRFLLGYQYMTCGHPASAAKQWQAVVKLMPNDRVAADMLKMVSAPVTAEPGKTPEQPTPGPDTSTTRPMPKPINAAKLVGTWKASRPDGSVFNLDLTSDEKFTWSFASKDQAAQVFGGTYSVEGNVLALQRKDGGALIAEVTSPSDKNFNFKLLGAPQDDKGLDFGR